MNSQGDEQQVLDGIESQLRTEDPRLIACFLAFNSVTPPIKPLTGWYRSTPRTGHRHTDRPARTDRRAKAGTAELALLAIAFIMFAVLVAALVWSPGLLA
jgi:Protein of unknown function (DUF3040)